MLHSGNLPGLKLDCGLSLKKEDLADLQIHLKTCME